MPTTKPDTLFHPGTGGILYPVTHTIAVPANDMFFTWHSRGSKTHRIIAIHEYIYANKGVADPDFLWETACKQMLGYYREAQANYLTPGPVTCARCLKKEPA